MQEEVLMPRSVNRRRFSQPTLFHPPLFHPPHPRPSFQTLPPEIQEKTIKVLSRLLRLHADRGLAATQTKEACDE
jgi:hypothetical protein